MNRKSVNLILVCILAALLYPHVHQWWLQHKQQQYLLSLKSYSMDFSTPQGALLCLEDAYRRNDTEAAVACKDFYTEAVLMREDIDPNFISEENLLKLAETLELAYRKGIQEKWPDFHGLESYFAEAVPYRDNVVCVKEICRFPDGHYSEQRILVAKSGGSWKVLYPLD